MRQYYQSIKLTQHRNKLFPKKKQGEAKEDHSQVPRRGSQNKDIFKLYLAIYKFYIFSLAQERDLHLSNRVHQGSFWLMGKPVSAQYLIQNRTEYKDIMQEAPYSEYMAMGKDRIKFVQNQTQGEAKPCNFIREKYSEENFVELYGSQDKKAIKLATFREINRTPEAKGIVFIFHSMGMHTGVTAHLADRLAKEGFIAVGFDQRGHGKSQGERGYLDDQKEILKDCGNFISKTLEIHPKLPYFYFGHGSGALMSIALAKERKDLKPSGLIVGSPSLKKPENSKVVSALSDFALKIMPKRAGLFAFNYNNVTRNPTASSLLINDPLMYHQKVFVKTLMEMQEVMELIEEKLWGKLQLPPIVVIQGELDRASDAVNSIRFFEALPIKEKQIWYYRKMWHMFLYEEEYVEIEDRVVGWLKQRLQS